MKKPVNVLIVEDSRISQEIMESAIARSKGRYTIFYQYRMHPWQN